MKRVFADVDELLTAVGEHLGYSEWVLVDQARVDLFAKATGDHQWIHLDAARAAAGPFGGTVAHGYLTLAMLPALIGSIVDYAGWGVRVNYGTNKVRFPSPVLVGSRVRAGAELAAVDVNGAGAQVTVRVTVESQAPDGTPGAKPALVAELLTLLTSPSVDPPPFSR